MEDTLILTIDVAKHAPADGGYVLKVTEVTDLGAI